MSSKTFRPEDPLIIKRGFLNKKPPKAPRLPNFQEKLAPDSRDSLRNRYRREVAEGILVHKGFIEPPDPDPDPDPELGPVAKKPRWGLRTPADLLLEDIKYFNGEGNEMTKHILPEHRREIRKRLVAAANEYLKTNPTDPDELREIHNLLYDYRPIDQQVTNNFTGWTTESDSEGGRRTRKNRKSRKKFKRNNRKSRR